MVSRNTQLCPRHHGWRGHAGAGRWRASFGKPLDSLSKSQAVERCKSDGAEFHCDWMDRNMTSGDYSMTSNGPLLTIFTSFKRLLWPELRCDCVPVEDASFQRIDSSQRTQLAHKLHKDDHTLSFVLRMMEVHPRHTSVLLTTLITNLLHDTSFLSIQLLIQVHAVQHVIKLDSDIAPNLPTSSAWADLDLFPPRILPVPARVAQPPPSASDLFFRLSIFAYKGLIMPVPRHHYRRQARLRGRC
jgi:hypothetical protein